MEMLSNQSGPTYWVFLIVENNGYERKVLGIMGNVRKDKKKILVFFFSLLLIMNTYIHLHQHGFDNVMTPRS